MDFLRVGSKPKIVRTRLYGDQEFSRFELELLHTPLLQRLYNLKQLGFTDKVYPDAVHARFNHILGATEVVDRMAHRLLIWLEGHASTDLQFEASNATIQSVTCGDLAKLLRQRLPTIRLMALLHDVTHSAFGHTLEDEVNVFDEKHDDPERQIRFFNGLTAQLLYLWVTEERLHEFDGSRLQGLANLQLSAEHVEELRWADELAEHLSTEDASALAEQLRYLELAERLLLNIEFAHGKEAPHTQRPLLTAQIVAVLAPSVAAFDLELYRDIYMIDLVGNTICADLLDYARRDADQAGLRVQFDDRFLRYLCVVSVGDSLAPAKKKSIRTAIQIFTDKMRHDVLSEMSGVLKARYLINERVLFHPTKCAAGAMLGTAVQLLGLRDLPEWMQVLGDEDFLHVLNNLATNIHYLATRAETQPDEAWSEIVRVAWPADRTMADLVSRAVSWIVPTANTSKILTAAMLEEVRTRAKAAQNVLARLTARRFGKLAYRIRSVHHSTVESDETLASTYCKPADRYALERKIERMCSLPMGAVSVHCPKRKTSMKVAEVLVVGSDLSEAAHLRDVTKVSPEGLVPYENEIRAIEDMYKSIWQFHAFLDPAHWGKWPVVAWAFELSLKFPNDKMLAEELAKDGDGAYWLLATELKEEVPPKSLPLIIERVEAELAPRMRHGPEHTDPRDRLRAIILEAVAGRNPEHAQQLGLPGVRGL